MITATYAALLALWLVFLSMRVIALRGNPMFAFLAFGRRDDTSLERAIRAHGNLAEYAPTMLILLYLLEQGGATAAVLQGLGAAFLAGRILHGVCFGFMRERLPLRIGGTVLTLSPILIAAILLLT